MVLKLLTSNQINSYAFYFEMPQIHLRGPFKEINFLPLLPDCSAPLPVCVRLDGKKYYICWKPSGSFIIVLGYIMRVL